MLASLPNGQFAGDPLKKWRDVRTSAEQERLAAEAMRIAGTVDGAAKLLGISRRHLTRFRAETVRLVLLNRTDETDRTHGTNETGETGETPRLIETRYGGDSGETITPNVSLTYGRTEPILSSMATAANTARMDEPEGVKITAEDVPAELAQWLDEEAMREKHRLRLSRQAKSPIIIRALQEYRERREAAAREAEGSKPGATR
jgi:hypothetical protein